jgi:hypothetical protein
VCVTVSHLHPSLIFVGKASSLPVRVVSRKGKLYPRVNVTDIDKHTSLLQCSLQYKTRVNGVKNTLAYYIT